MKERSIYTIEFLNIYDAKKRYRSVDHLYRICFTQRTLVKEVLPQPECFPTFAYNAFPFSVLANRVDENILLSDVVDLVRKVTADFGANRQRKGNIYITDGKQQAVVTLWGQLADNFDAEGLREASADEPIVVLFIGMTVGQLSGMLAFKSTSITRCTKTLLIAIEWHDPGQN